MKTRYIPTEDQNPKGLHLRYNITKANGEPVDENAEYFVLRLDRKGSDQRHIDAGRKAMLTYAYHIQDHLPELSADIIDRYSDPFAKLDDPIQRKGIVLEDWRDFPSGDKAWDVSRIEFDAPQPYIVAFNNRTYQDERYFSIPPSIAYYATVHAGFTHKGRERVKEEGRRVLQSELRDLLGIEED